MAARRKKPRKKRSAEEHDALDAVGAELDKQIQKALTDPEFFRSLPSAQQATIVAQRLPAVEPPNERLVQQALQLEDMLADLPADPTAHLAIAEAAVRKLKYQLKLQIAVNHKLRMKRENFSAKRGDVLMGQIWKAAVSYASQRIAIKEKWDWSNTEIDKRIRRWSEEVLGTKRDDEVSKLSEEEAPDEEVTRRPWFLKSLDDFLV